MLDPLKIRSKFTQEQALERGIEDVETIENRVIESKLIFSIADPAKALKNLSCKDKCNDYACRVKWFCGLQFNIAENHFVPADLY